MTRPIRISADAVHLWRAFVDEAVLDEAYLCGVLSPAERERAASFCFETDRWRFIRRRVILRQILSFYAGIEPGSLRIATRCLHCDDRTHGKPRIVNADRSSQITFNASSAGNMAVYVIARSRQVGIDIETVDSGGKVINRISKAILSEQEITDLQSLPPSLHTQAAVCAWTQKEAYLKGTGHGLAVDPRLIRVAVGPRVPTSVIQPLAGDEWWMQCIVPAEGYLGALAVHAAMRVSILGWYSWPYSEPA